MKLGFSLYDALTSYTGQHGLMLTVAQFEQLIALVSQRLRLTRVEKVLARLDDTISLRIKRGVSFVVPGEQGMFAPNSWTVHQIAQGDPLTSDRFLLIADNALPFVLVAKRTSQGYRAFVSIDIPAIEGAKSLLSQYRPELKTSSNFDLGSHFTAGTVVAYLQNSFDSSLIISWISDALQQGDAVGNVQQLLEAVWLRWKNQDIGKIPATTQGYHLQRVQVGSTVLFEAIAPTDSAQASEFGHRCYACAGYLKTIQDLQASAAKQQAQNDLLSDFSIDKFLFGTDVNRLRGLPDQSPSQVPQAPQKESTEPIPFPAPSVTESNGHKNRQLDPEINRRLLRHVGGKLTVIRDSIFDSGALGELSSDSRAVVQSVVQISSELLMLLDEAVYIEEIIEQVEANLELLDLNMLLDALVMTYAGEAERRGVTLTTTLNEELPVIEGNAEAINRAMMTMLESAIDRTEGVGTVEIGARVNGGAKVILFTRDDGEQLTQEDQKLLFSPNFDGQGTSGLGLSTVRSIAEAHQGEFDVSREGNHNLSALHLSIQRK